MLPLSTIPNITFEKYPYTNNFVRRQRGRRSHLWRYAYVAGCAPSSALTSTLSPDSRAMWHPGSTSLVFALFGLAALWQPSVAAYNESSLELLLPSAGAEASRPDECPPWCAV